MTPSTSRPRAFLPLDLSDALLRAALAHGEHEKRTGEHDEQWPAWYAEYMVREQAGEEPSWTEQLSMGMPDPPSHPWVGVR